MGSHLRLHLNTVNACPPKDNAQIGFIYILLVSHAVRVQTKQHYSYLLGKFNSLAIKSSYRKGPGTRKRPFLAQHIPREPLEGTALTDNSVPKFAGWLHSLVFEYIVYPCKD